MVAGGGRNRVDPRCTARLITTSVQALAGVLLPSATVFLLLLCNDREVLGPWSNPGWLNAIAAVIIGVLVEMSLVLVATVAFPTINVSKLFVDLSIVLVLCLLAGGSLCLRARTRAGEGVEALRSCRRTGARHGRCRRWRCSSVPVVARAKGRDAPAARLSRGGGRPARREDGAAWALTPAAARPSASRRRGSSGSAAAMRWRVVEQQARDRHGVKAALAQPADDRGQGRDRLRAVAAAVVHEDDRAWMGARERALHDRGGAGQACSRRCRSTTAPSAGAAVQHAERGGVERAVGRSEQAGPRPAEQFDAGDCSSELFVLFVRREQGHHRVRLGVVADDVS